MSDRTVAPWWIRVAARLLRPVLDEVARQRAAARAVTLTLVPFTGRDAAEPLVTRPFVARLRRIEADKRRGRLVWTGAGWRPAGGGDAA